jgi:HSP20 family protein
MPKRKKPESLEKTPELPGSIGMLHRQVNELFDQFFDFEHPHGFWPAWLEKNGNMSQFQLEVSETDREVKVRAELPGVEEDDIQVTIEDNVLTVSAEKKNEREQEEKDLYVSEVSYGRFERSVLLPGGLELDKGKASFKRGVLKINFPKSAEEKSRKARIPVTAE